MDSSRGGGPRIDSEKPGLLTAPIGIDYRPGASRVPLAHFTLTTIHPVRSQVMCINTTKINNLENFIEMHYNKYITRRNEMTTTFTTYTDALNAVSMVESFALRNGMRVPQFTIVYLNGSYHVTKD